MVVIVGAGPTGLVTALLLARHGVPSLVLERHPRPYPLPRAVHLDDECVRILQKAGVAEGFARISRPAPGLRFLDAHHRPLAEFQRSELVGMHGHPQANLFDQPDLQELLLAAVAREPRVELRVGVRVTGVDAEGRVHWVSDPKSTMNDAFEHAGVIAADAVVGCDGAGGVVGRAIGSHPRRLGSDQTWFVADILGDPPARSWDGVEQICDPARPATYLRVGERRLRWEFRMRPGETAAELAQRLDELVRPWLPDGVGNRQVLRTAAYVFRAQVADRWHRGRVLLAGDAAHLTPPFIGQGLGSGLRDAANLSWKLARVLHGQAGDELLDSYPAERAPHATALIRLALIAGTLISPPVPGPIGELVSAATSTALRAAGRSDRITQRLLAGTSPPLRSGPLTPPRLSRLGRQTLVGTLFPQIPLETNVSRPFDPPVSGADEGPGPRFGQGSEFRPDAAWGARLYEGGSSEAAEESGSRFGPVSGFGAGEKPGSGPLPPAEPLGLLDDRFGPGFVLIIRSTRPSGGTQPAPPAQSDPSDEPDGTAAGILDLAARLGAPIVHSRDRGLAGVHHWLIETGLDAVLLRPDRVILATEPGSVPARNPGVTNLSGHPPGRSGSPR